MKTLKSEGLIRDEDLAKFPEGNIKNQTELEAGTPVVREVYGDVLINLYKLLELTKNVPTGTEDGELSQYQIIDSLRQFTNVLNDQNQLLTKISVDWSINIDLELLPDKYVIFAKADEDWEEATSGFGPQIRFRGAAATPIYDVSSTGFSVGDDVIIIIDQSTVRIISLTQSKILQDATLYTGLGSPLSYDETNILKYEIEGNLVFNDPRNEDLIEKIKTLSGDPNVTIYDTIVFKKYVICMVNVPSLVDKLKFYQFELANLTSVEEIALTLSGGVATEISSLEIPYMYCDGEYIYVTNNAGTSANGNELAQLDYVPADAELNFTSLITLNASFTKSTNAALKFSAVFTLINSVLKKYTYAGAEIIVDDYKSVDGILFNFNGFVHYTNGETGVKWKI